MYLKQVREARGITQKELAKNLGIQPNTISRYETGEREPDVHTLIRLADYLDVTVDYLLNGEQKQNTYTQGEDELSVDERVEQLMSGISDSSGGTLMLDGEPASPEAIESLRGALKQAVETARAVNKARRKE